MIIDKLLIGTHNQGKADFFKKNLADTGLEILTLDDLKITEDPEETGETFADNALLKAKLFYKLSGIPTLSDDSGLMIDALNGEPGVKSRRWLGHYASDQELVDILLKKLDNVSEKDSTAKFVSSIAIVITPEIILRAEAETRGYIKKQPQIPYKPRVPWSSHFYIPLAGKVHGALSQEESKKFSHRGLALDKIKKQLNDFIKH